MGDKWGTPQPRSEEGREESTPPPRAPQGHPDPPLAHTPLTPAPRSSSTSSSSPRGAPGAGNAPAARARACSRRTCLAPCPAAPHAGWAFPAGDAGIPHPLHLPTLSAPPHARARPSQASASSPLPPPATRFPHVPPGRSRASPPAPCWMLKPLTCHRRLLSLPHKC